MIACTVRWLGDEQGCTGRYTGVHDVYQPPVYFAGAYSPQLLYINRIYAGYTLCRMAYVQTIPRQDKSVTDSDCQPLSCVRDWDLRATIHQNSTEHTRVCYLLVSYNCQLLEVCCFDVITKVYYSVRLNECACYSVQSLSRRFSIMSTALSGIQVKKMHRTVLSFDKPAAKKPTATNYSCTSLSCVCFMQLIKTRVFPWDPQVVELYFSGCPKL